MQAEIPQAQVATVGLQRVDIGNVALGPIAIGTLALDGMHLELSTGSARFIGFGVTVSLTMSMEWRVSVTIPHVHSWQWSGRIDLGTHQIAVNFGDIEIPGLDSFVLDLDSLTVENVAATLGPIQSLQLGPLVAERITAQALRSPVPPFQLTGLGLDRLEIRDLAVPGTTADAVTIARVSGEAFPIGTVTVPGISLPEASLGEIASENIDMAARSNPIDLHADAGVVDFTLRVVPAVSAHVDRLVLDNVRSAGAVGSVELRDVTLPYELLDLRLADIGIGEISIPVMEVS
jgi:hypothetical protein